MGQRLISVSGGRHPVWSADGRELFYRGPRRGLWAVPIRTDPTFTSGAPELLFTGNYYFEAFVRSYDVAPDGQRFLMISRDDLSDADDTPPRLVYVDNWVEELKTLVPAP